MLLLLAACKYSPNSNLSFYLKLQKKKKKKWLHIIKNYATFWYVLYAIGRK